VNATTNNKELAEAQVAAFMATLKAQHDLDDEKISRMIAVAQKNGKTYVTWAWIITGLLGLASFFAVRYLDTIDKRLDAIEAKQADVRERLRTNEELLREHMRRNGATQ
jgi:hypothetical protein